MNGIEEKIIALWKPKKISSNGFLNMVRKISGIKKAGHAGTLDPLAEGVLVVGIGKATKMLARESGAEKEYIASVRFGAYSSTDDEEGEKKDVPISGIPARKDVKRALGSLTGTINQIPPAFSAIKIKGKEAYKLARAGKNVEMKPRKAEVKKIELLDYAWPFAEFKIVTGPGVYIRSVARDLGKKLGVGGYLFSLKRTRVGRFSESDALSLDKFAELAGKPIIKR